MVPRTRTVSCAKAVATPDTIVTRAPRPTPASTTTAILYLACISSSYCRALIFIKLDLSGEHLARTNAAKYGSNRERGHRHHRPSALVLIFTVGQTWAREVARTHKGLDGASSEKPPLRRRGSSRSLAGAHLSRAWRLNALRGRRGALRLGHPNRKQPRDP